MLAGCTEWTKIGMSRQIRDQDLAECSTQADGMAPVLAIIDPGVGRYEETGKVCRQDERQRTECSYTFRTWVPPVGRAMDGNAGVREASVKACMQHKGYRKT